MSDQYSPDSEYFIRYEIDEPTYERQSSLAAESTVVIFGKDLGMTKKQLISISLLAAGYFFIWCYFALFAPFFPHEAMKKGQSSSHIGAIFGVYQLVLLIGCPIFGKYLNAIGVRFLVVSGFFLSAGSMLSFGFLGECPDGNLYFFLAIASRAVTALGGSMSLSYAIATQFFPNNAGTIVAVLEIFIGCGLMVGPFLGGILYQFGGFQLPFFTLGGIMTILFLIAYFIFPDIEQVSDEGQNNVSLPYLPLFKIMKVNSTLLMLFCGSFAISFIEPSIQTHLLPLNLSPIELGLVFLVPAMIYVILTPFVGRWCDKKPEIMPGLIVFSTFFSIVSFSFFGPLPWFKMELKLGTFLSAYTLFGISFSILIVPTYADLIVITRKNGYPNDLRTQGLISGVYSSVYSIGALLGPVIGGVLVDLIGFNLSTFITVILLAFGGLFYTFVLLLETSSCVRNNSDRVNQLPISEAIINETKPLLTKKRFNRFRKRTYSFH